MSDKRGYDGGEITCLIHGAKTSVSSTECDIGNIAPLRCAYCATEELSGLWQANVELRNERDALLRAINIARIYHIRKAKP